jgi:hypothetical protein
LSREHEAEIAHRARQIEDGERQGDRHDSIPNRGHALAEEEEAKRPFA